MRPGDGSWAAWQYHMPLHNVGVAYYFRQSPDTAASMIVSLNDIDPKVTYGIEIFKTSEIKHTEVKED